MGKTGLRHAPNSDRRVSDRVALNRTGILRIDGDSGIKAVIADLTRDGCRIVTTHALARGRVVEIGLAGVGTVEARIIWQGANGYGCQFLTSLPPGAVTAATRNNVVALEPNGSATQGMSPVHYQEAKMPAGQRALVIGGVALAGWAVIIATGILLFA